MVEATSTQNRAVIQSLVSLVVTLAIMGVLLFWPAGTLDWSRALWFFASFVVAILIAIVVLWRLNPEIFAARSRIQPGTKLWDYIFITLVIGGFIAILPVAGLDFRLGGANAPHWVVAVGYVIFVISFVGQTWPQAVNRHFEPGVRIQDDRGQTVIDTGPYAIVRHPGYISGSLLALSIALVLGSYWALIPVAVVVVGLMVRTVFEERTLRDGLPGYTAYTQRVKYRWVPGVW
jgi:protein-S-isoprenylcysteine O-methyltransferase Ste14